jgi:hypothetical protein
MYNIKVIAQSGLASRHCLLGAWKTLSRIADLQAKIRTKDLQNIKQEYCPGDHNVQCIAKNVMPETIMS